QLYAATYPSEIGGLVLVASNHPREDLEFDKHLTKAQIDADRAETLQNFEGLDPFQSFSEALVAGPLLKVPFVVISSGVSAAGLAEALEVALRSIGAGHSRISYDGSTLAPADEVCYLRVESPGRAAVEALIGRLAWTDARISELVEID